MKKLVSTLLSTLALVAVLAPAAVANSWVVSPGGMLDPREPLEPLPCICLPPADIY
jgi:hypothetical protein